MPVPVPVPVPAPVPAPFMSVSVGVYAPDESGACAHFVLDRHNRLVYACACEAQRKESGVDVKTEFAEDLADAMEAKGLSLRKTAELARLNAGYLSEILGGRTKPGERAVRLLADVLELDPDALVIKAGRLFPEGSQRRIAADLLARVKTLEASQRSVAP